MATTGIETAVAKNALRAVITGKTVTWNTSDPSVATVVPTSPTTARVTAVGPGTANITAVVDGITSNACLVTVS